jgi:hypothetical protein
MTKFRGAGIDYDGQLHPDAEYDNGSSGAGTVTIDWSKGNRQKILMTGNCHFATPLNMKAGSICSLRMTEDATGNRVPTYQAGTFEWLSGSAPILGGPNVVDIIAWYSDGTKMYGSNGVGPAGPTGEAGPPGASFTLSTVEVNLGTVPSLRRSGRFLITGLSGLTAGKAVSIQQANGPYTGKGTREDEAEVDQILVTGKVLNSTTIQCFWSSRYKVRGNFKFNYSVSA